MKWVMNMYILYEKYSDPSKKPKLKKNMDIFILALSCVQVVDCRATSRAWP